MDRQTALRVVVVLSVRINALACTLEDPLLQVGLQGHLVNSKTDGH